MRIKRLAVGLAVALCALCAFSAQAFAKEKIVFGEFEASVHGKTLAPGNGAKLGVYKEGSIDFTGVDENGPENKAHDVAALNLGGTEFGPRYSKDVYIKNRNDEEVLIHKAGEIEAGKPACERAKVSGEVTAEHFSELAFKLELKKCVTYLEEENNPNRNEKVLTKITLPIVLRSNWSAEIGARESVLEIPETTLTVKLGLKKCPIEIPEQTIPVKDNPEKLYEEYVEYENEEEEPENIEHSKKLKELYPGEEKHLLNIVFGERFKGIRSYGSNTAPCSSKTGEENSKIVEEPGKHFGQVEFKNGHLFGEIDEMEVKDGNLGFKEPEE